MAELWKFLKDRSNKPTLRWLGGGVVVAAGGLWVAVTFFFQPHPSVKAVDHSVAAGRDVTISVPAPGSR